MNTKTGKWGDASPVKEIIAQISGLVKTLDYSSLTYHSNCRNYYGEIRRISDELCRKYGLSVIQTNSGKGMHYSQWQAEKEGRPTWRSAIRLDIREAVEVSFTWKQFLAEMEKKGYAWKADRKYPALKAPGMERYVRLKSLGKNYTEMALRDWILEPKKGYKPAGKGERKSLGKKYTGLQALYYSYYNIFMVNLPYSQ